MITLARPILGLLAACALANGAPVLADTVIYQTGFEAPTYFIGALNGQDGWVSTALPAVVQHSPAVVGTQAAAFSASGVTGQALAGHPLVYNSVGSAEPFVRVRCDALLGTGGTPSGAWEVVTVFGNHGFIGHILVDNANIAQLGLAKSSVGSVPIQRGVWNHFELDLNFQTGIQTAYVNGLYIGQAAFATVSTTLAGFYFGVNSGPGTDLAALDVLSVTSGGLTACCAANTGVCTVAPFCPPGTAYSSPIAPSCAAGVCVPACGTTAFSAPVNYAFAAGPPGVRSVAVGDFNGDGVSDLVIAGGGVLLGSVSGIFAPAPSSPIGMAAGNAVAVADFNRDGKLDVVAANSAGGVDVWLGNGDGTFQIGHNFAAGNGPFALAVGDINGDGKLDLAVANIAGNNVSILLGFGNGTFQAPMNIPTAQPTSVAIADLNGDGKADLIVANGSVSVFLGYGDGTFADPVSYGVSSAPIAMALGDFNGDGKVDIVTANQGSDDVSILLGTGTGTFQAAANITVGNGPYSVAVGDFNGDGKADLVVANALGDNISILAGLGNGTFQSPVDFPAGSFPASVAFGFFGTDTMPGLAIANLASHNVSVLTNICMGACCNFITGGCSVTLQSACGLASHTWLAAAVCTPNNCEQPGGCCDVHLACTRRTLSQCPAGSLWTAGGASSCTTVPCTTLGRCCNFVTGSCSLTLISACGPAAHTWDVGGVCSPNTCQQNGTCCTNSTGACRRSTLSRCTGDVAWLVSNVCSPNPCPAPSGVCCNFVTGACAITTQAACGLGSHTWNLGGSCIPANPCPPIAACCDGTGACRRLTRERCLSLPGAWINGAMCSPSPCAGLLALAWCRADFNHSGTVDTADVFDFLSAWLSGGPAADRNGTGFSVQELFDFLDAWFAGC